MGMLNASSVKSFSGNCRGKVLEKFQIFLDKTADAGFPLRRAPAASLESSALCGQHVRVARPKSRTGCLGVVLVNCQLNGGADTTGELEIAASR
jgi:hypothetical protein